MTTILFHCNRVRSQVWGYRSGSDITAIQQEGEWNRSTQCKHLNETTFLSITSTVRFVRCTLLKVVFTSTNVPQVEFEKCQPERWCQQIRGRCRGAGGWWCASLVWSGRTWMSGCSASDTLWRRSARSCSPSRARKCPIQEEKCQILVWLAELKS